MAERPQGGPGDARLLWLVTAVVIAVAVIGFMTGVQESRYVSQDPPPRAPRDLPMSDDVQPARTHAELAQRPWRGGAEAEQGRTWDPRTKPGAAIPSSPVGADRAPIDAALASREENRAFAGAPPTIPHPVRQGSASECLSCHASGMQLGPSLAARIPHAYFQSCTQCHVVSATTVPRVDPNPAAQAASRFVGAASVREGERAYAGAPPTIPHTTLLREACDSCHGPTGRAALRTPHPDRLSCQQCHAPSAALDQRSRS